MCLDVGVHPGIGAAETCANPDAKATIQTSAGWCSRDGAPRTIEHDQGTRCTAVRSKN